ncbi:uncharacterized protein ACLA_005820 [Aspergillus clavatus NRRL 1]|uniref:Uncharacterized protein n=1 Tax=Aspergillus clavatus (strain ATCC 1007 / CBS 513.65 / DSM 816 / NCTC 3887 / NRRL 1 / QM 1276 / 107) TaxID=344612 RepID=A1CD99_ASPCL|nr:uncharacterized protein ACLA_005820 [Aspergillus clavatus NRRL 1]EAW11826.1 hypothetical protein ACLA_005820 [Aspergillus clavatus NRRL 1]
MSRSMLSQSLECFSYHAITAALAVPLASALLVNATAPRDEALSRASLAFGET